MENNITFKEKCIFDSANICYALKEKDCKECKFFKSEKEWEIVPVKGTYIKTSKRKGA